MNILIAGYGPVGRACNEALKVYNIDDVSVYIDDPYLGYEFPESASVDMDAVIICVATPARPDGSCYTKNVQDVLQKYAGCKFLIKSACDPVWLNTQKHDVRATGGSLTVSPEFLRGTTGADPIQDFIDQEFAIYGGDDCRFWHELFKPALPKLKEVRFISLEQAGFAKYLENCFLATKVTFFNEMYRLFHKIGFEGFDQMVEAITLDPRIGFSHTQVPGPDGKFGFGGHCLPKDISAMIDFTGGEFSARTDCPEPTLLKTVRQINEETRNEQ